MARRFADTTVPDAATGPGPATMNNDTSLTTPVPGNGSTGNWTEDGTPYCAVFDTVGAKGGGGGGSGGSVGGSGGIGGGGGGSVGATVGDDEDYNLLFEFIAYGVLLNVIGVLGILGNIISMIILSRPQMKSSINYLLIGLARCDTVLIITSIILFGLPVIYPSTNHLFVYYFKVRWPHLSTPSVSLFDGIVSMYLWKETKKKIPIEHVSVGFPFNRNTSSVKSSWGWGKDMELGPDKQFPDLVGRWVLSPRT